MLVKTYTVDVLFVTKLQSDMKLSYFVFIFKNNLFSIKPFNKSAV